MEFALHNAWLIAAIPLAASFLIAAFAKQLREPAAGYFGAGAMFLSFLLSLGVFFAAVGHGGHEAVPYGAGGEPLAQWVIANWAVFGGKAINLTLMIDNLSAATLVMVTLVSTCVQIYSTGYMHGDKRFTRFFAAVNLFTTGMLLAVMAGDLFILLVGWEIMGLCSYLLIGHWYEQEWPQMGSMKAFLTTRVGDVFMMFGVFWIFMLTGSINFNEIAAALPTVDKGALLGAAILLFGGPVGKSAQFPLHTWLPDAMAGPTPGSALIHAATMVAVGVYFVARAFAIFGAGGGEVMALIAIIGALTSFLAATIATLRTDLKQVLAYSTISQLGYMMLALGVGSFSAGTFHLMTHAFFKSLLFLAAGSVIHAVHTQEMHQMGGLRKKLPWTFLVWMAGYLALAGFPLTSGFFSKDELLLAAWNWSHTAFFPHDWAQWIGYVPFWLGAGTAFLTAYYMTRATYLTFFGQPRDHHAYEHAHESGTLMVAPLVPLAILALVSGYIWAPLFGIEWWEHFTSHPDQALAHDGKYFVMGLATTLGLLGIALGIWLYKYVPGRTRAGVIRGVHPVYVLLKRMYYMDELYDIIFTRFGLALSRLTAAFDRYVVDGIVNLVGHAGWAAAQVHGWFDRTFVDGAVNLAGALTVMGGRQFRRLATGYVQSYMMTFAVVVVFGAVVIYWIFRG